MNTRKRKFEGKLFEFITVTLKNQLPYVKWNSESVNKEQQNQSQTKGRRLRISEGRKAKRSCLDQNHKLIYV